MQRQRQKSILAPEPKALKSPSRSLWALQTDESDEHSKFQEKVSEREKERTNIILSFILVEPTSVERPLARLLTEASNSHSSKNIHVRHDGPRELTKSR